MGFFQDVYEIVKKIPYGKVISYGDIARILGNPRMARQVGWALHVNPSPEEIPCYRVVNSKGELAKEFAFGGADRQAELLRAEGVEVMNGKVDLERYGLKSSL